MHQGGGLKSVTFALGSQEVRGQPLELVIDQRNQFGKGFAVAAFHLGQQQRHLARGVMHRDLKEALFYLLFPRCPHRQWCRGRAKRAKLAGFGTETNELGLFSSANLARFGSFSDTGMWPPFFVLPAYWSDTESRIASSFLTARPRPRR